jgi:hypothetical protein
MEPENWESLPEDVVFQIFRWLPAHKVLSLTPVCKMYKSHVNNPKASVSLKDQAKNSHF